MTMPPDPLEPFLAEAAEAARWPATPDLRDGVLARIIVAPAPGTRALGHSGRRARRRSLLGALAFALLALLLAAGLATALGYRLPGLDIVFGEPLPPAGRGLDLGRETPLADVRGMASPRVLLPAVLPEPSAAFVRDAGDATIVTLAWRAGPGEPALAGSDLALSLMAVPGRPEDSLLRKMLGPGSTIEPVSVNGDRGWWISGAPHELLIANADGAIVPLAAVLAGDTLVFARGGTLYRLESSLGRDRTLEIAASVR